jgi:hypothetical protein
VEIDVDEIRNTGKFEARLQIPEGALVLSIDRFHEFSPCQSGGVAAYIYEHGDSGCGDTNWPKTFVYVAGWGYGRATLGGRGEPGGAAAGLLHPQPAGEPGEQPSAPGLRALLRDGGHLEMTTRARPSAISTKRLAER